MGGFVPAYVRIALYPPSDMARMEYQTIRREDGDPSISVHAIETPGTVYLSTFQRRLERRKDAAIKYRRWVRHRAQQRAGRSKPP